MKKVILAVAVVALWLPASALAAVVVGPQYYEGSRTTTAASDQIVAADGWTYDKGGFTVSWDVTPPDETPNGLWLFEYTVSTAPFSSDPTKPNQKMVKAISHWILEVSPTITTANWQWYLRDVVVTGGTAMGVDDFTGGAGNPDLPGSLHGMKFDFSTGDASHTITFSSMTNPVWGDFYAKDGTLDGEWATAWNTDIGTDPDLSGPFSGHIATVDTTLVPEPGLGVLALAALGAGAWGRRRGRKRAPEMPEDAA